MLALWTPGEVLCTTLVGFLKIGGRTGSGLLRGCAGLGAEGQDDDEDVGGGELGGVIISTSGGEGVEDPTGVPGGDGGGDQHCPMWRE